MLSATGPPHPPAPAPPESAESADRADPVSSPPGRCPSTRVDLVFANTIIAGQQGTYRHLHTRVTALLADSGQNREGPLVLSLPAEPVGCLKAALRPPLRSLQPIRAALMAIGGCSFGFGFGFGFGELSS